MIIVQCIAGRACGWCGSGTAALLRLAVVTAPCCGRPGCLGGLKLLDEAEADRLALLDEAADNRLCVAGTVPAS